MSQPDTNIYKRVEYIESTGAQYIDTGLTFDSSTMKIETKFYNLSSSGSLVSFGVRSSGAVNAFYRCGTAIVIGDASGYVALTTHNPGLHTLSFSGLELIFDGTTYTSSKYTTPSTNVYLFAMNEGNSPICKSTDRIYYFKMYSNNVLVRDFIPVQRLSDGINGLYDRVNNVFYYNNGENFIAGPDIGYTRLMYLQSTGTQYIDTNIAIEKNTWVELNVMFDQIFAYNMVMGAWSDFAFALKEQNTACVAVGKGQEQTSGNVPITSGQKYHVVIGPGYGYSVDLEKRTVGGAENNTGRHILLFACSDDSTGNLPYAWGGSYGKAKIYGFRIYRGITNDRNNSELIGEFIPVRDPDGINGMFDNISGIFYPDAAGGNFVAGPDFTIKELQYIESTGTQYIHTKINKDALWEYDLQFTDTSTRQLMGYGGNAFEYWGTTDGVYKPASLSSVTRNVPVGNRDILTQYYFSDNRKGYVNGELVYEYGYTAITKEAQIFTITNSGIQPTTYACRMKLYSCNVWLNEDRTGLIRSFIPAMDIEDHRVGLYDTVTDTFFYDGGGKDFLPGPIKTLKSREKIYFNEGGMYPICLPKGIYKLETWGSQGGTYSTYGGGYGGYSVGTLTITEPAKTLYCCVGQQPATNSTNRTVSGGGYNGGGDGFNRYSSSTYSYGQGGGGASHIGLKDGLLATFESDYSSQLLLCAGGGGGSSSEDARTTKYGGGLEGGSPAAGFGGTQTEGGTATANINKGTFGQGGSTTTEGSNYKYGSGGGGGGFYGGGACSTYNDSTNYRGYNGGGSGWVNNSLLTDAGTYGYNDGVNYANEGDGKIIITVIKTTKDFDINARVKTEDGWKTVNKVLIKTNSGWKNGVHIESKQQNGWK